MLKIPTIEETVESGAYEARMHFLCPDGKFGRYITQPGQVTEPTEEAVQKELTYDDYPGLLMWVDFAKPEIIGMIEDTPKRAYAIESSPVMGKIVIATNRNKFEQLDEYMNNSPENNSFVKLWLGKYAVDRTRNFFGDHRHPLGQLGGLYMQLGIRKELDMWRWRAKAEEWDPRIDVKEWYIARLARLARRDNPDLFSGGSKSWHRQMGFPLRHRSRPH